MNIKEEYNKKLKELKEVEEELSKLQKDEKVKSYNFLSYIKKDLTNEKDELYKKLRNEEFDKCHHLLITTYCEPSRVGNNYNYCGCLKCGLNEKVKHVDGWFIDYNELSLDEQIMFDYLSHNIINRDKITDVVCDLDLAKAIYDKILEKYPKINDKLALKYLEIALDNIRNIKTTEERKESRIKRLGLYPSFNKWNKEDIIKKL